jgi:hypothetical protein
MPEIKMFYGGSRAGKTMTPHPPARIPMACTCVKPIISVFHICPHCVYVHRKDFHDLPPDVEKALDKLRADNG